ncbi:MAG: hypothetical protein U0452_09735 [Anaerolineae bacterium]
MAKPIILTVDDDPAVLSAIERDLRQHYASQYRIVKAVRADALDVVLKFSGAVKLSPCFWPTNACRLWKAREFLGEAITFFSQRAQGAADRVCRYMSGYPEHQRDRPRLLPAQTLGSARTLSVSRADDLLTEWSRTATAILQRHSGGRHALVTAVASGQDFLSRNRISYAGWISRKTRRPPRWSRRSISPVRRFRSCSFRMARSCVITAREIAEKVGLNTQAALPLYDARYPRWRPAGLQERPCITDLGRGFARS